MLCRIALFEKIYSLEAEKVIGRFLYGQKIPLGKFTDGRDYIFYHLFAMIDFRSESNRDISFESVSHSIDGIECQPLPAFDFGYCRTTHADALTDLCLSHAKLGPSLPEKLTDIIKSVFHKNSFPQN